jgi:hypothetical protein
MDFILFRMKWKREEENKGYLKIGERDGEIYQ